MADDRQRPVHAAVLMMGARVVNLAIGLLALPLLIRWLGGDGFAAWAVLLALGAGFSILEMGMATAIVRHVATEGNDGGRTDIGRAWVVLGASYTSGAAVLAFVAGPFAAWLGLPDTPMLGAVQSVWCVFCFVVARSFLQTGSLVLLARRRFAAVFLVSLLQPLCANVSALAVAGQTRRLDLALLAFWTAQCAVLFVAFVLVGRRAVPVVDATSFRAAQFRALCRFGVASQLESWAHFVNFQFDKFIVAGWLGLWGVAPYEVANRAVAALRSLPASGAESLLPAAAARQDDKAASWHWYRSSTKLASYGVVAFMLAPLAVSPVFLYAWTGEMGYVGRWVFVFLCLGAMANVLALPAGTLMQAAGRAEIPGRAALAAVLLNTVLTLSMVGVWGLVGAAAGSALAMVLAAGLLVHWAHRHFEEPVAATLKLVAELWAPALVCAVWAVLVMAAFDHWFDGLVPAERFARHTRVQPALAAGLAYGAVIASVIVVEIVRGRIPAIRSGRSLTAWIFGILERPSR